MTKPIYSPLADDFDLAELVAVFVQELPDRLCTLTTHAQDRDWKQLAHTAHQLKGAAGSFGFHAVTPLAARLEVAAQDGGQEGEILSAVEELLRLCRRLRPGTLPMPNASRPTQQDRCSQWSP